MWETVESSGASEQDPGGQVRLYVNVGRRQGLRTSSELASYIKSETDLPHDDLGRIQICESHSYVHVSGDKEQGLIEKLAGKEFKDRELRVERARARR